MKKISIYFLLLTFLPLANSCSSNDDSDRENKEAIDLICGEAGYTVGPPGPTICCVNGSDVASPGETLTFEYNSNLADPVFNWVVNSGAITIISGQNTSTVNVLFGSDFTTGEIACHSIGMDIRCGADFTINKK
ncbi:MAG: hypothetical protein V7655_14710 [Aequorivita antarctica]